MKRRGREVLAVLAHRRDPAIARAFVAGACDIDFEPGGRVALAGQRQRRPARRVGIDFQGAGRGQDARDLGRIAVVEIVAQPEDFRTACEMRIGDGLRGARPVGF